MHYYEFPTIELANSFPLAPNSDQKKLGRFLISPLRVPSLKRVYLPVYRPGAFYRFKDEECEEVFYAHSSSNGKIKSRYTRYGFIPDYIGWAGNLRFKSEEYYHIPPELQLLFQTEDGIATLGDKKYLVVHSNSGAYGINLEDTSDILHSFPINTTFEPIPEPRNFDDLLRCRNHQES